MRFLDIYWAYERARNKVITLFCASSFRGIGSNTVLALPVRLGGEEGIEIGKNVFIGSNLWIEVLDGENRAVPAVSIGDGTLISGFCTITAVERIIIESDVLIGRYVHISDHFHRYSDVSTPIVRQGITDPAPVRIRRGAWIGQGAVICPGVTMGQNAVIGANSVVCEDVDDYCVGVGAPARIIRRKDTPGERREPVLMNGRG